MLYVSVSVSATGVERIQELIAGEQLEEALRLTKDELSRTPDEVQYRFLEGLILTRMNRLEQAVEVFTGITESHPDLPEPYNNLAVIHAAMGNLDQARQALQQAINTHPSYATAHENIGDIYAKLASQAYSQALQLDQGNVTAKAKLSLINDLFSVPRTGQETTLAGAVEQTPPVMDEERQQQEPGPEPPPAEVAEAEQPVDDQEKEPPRETEQEVVESVRAAVHAWAEAWSSQDVEAYLGHYGPDYTPPAGQSLADWQQERRERIGAPRFIRLDISELQVEVLAEDYAQATFMQKYQSDTYGDVVTKLLLLSRKDDRWRIVQEATK